MLKNLEFFANYYRIEALFKNNFSIRKWQDRKKVVMKKNLKNNYEIFE